MTRVAVVFYQVLSALAFVWGGFNTILSGDVAIAAILFAVAGANLVAAIALWLQKVWGRWLSLANMIAQIPSITTSAFIYNYTGVGNIWLTAVIDPPSETYLFGFHAGIYPGTLGIWLGGETRPTEIYIGMLTIVLAAFALRPTPRGMP